MTKIQLNEIEDFTEKLYAWTDKHLYIPLDDDKGSWTGLKHWVTFQSYKYISFGVHNDIPYINVFGVKYPSKILNKDLYNDVYKRMRQYKALNLSQT